MGWASHPSRKDQSTTTDSSGNTTQQFTLPILQMGARVYIPTLGRFLQVDPIEGGTLNAYVYAHDPVNGEDYSGLFSFSSLFRFTCPFNRCNATKSLNQTKAVGRGVKKASKACWKDKIGCLGVAAFGVGLGLTVISPIPGDELAVGGATTKVASRLAGSGGGDRATSFVGSRYNQISVQRGTNIGGTVNNLSFKGHAFDQMQGRGIYPSVVQNTVDVGKVTQQANNTLLYYDDINDISAVLNKGGEVVTTFYGSGR